LVERTVQLDVAGRVDDVGDLARQPLRDRGVHAQRGTGDVARNRFHPPRHRIVRSDAPEMLERPQTLAEMIARLRPKEQVDTGLRLGEQVAREGAPNRAGAAREQDGSHTVASGLTSRRSWDKPSIIVRYRASIPSRRSLSVAVNSPRSIENGSGRTAKARTCSCRDSCRPRTSRSFSIRPCAAPRSWPCAAPRSWPCAA